MNLLKGLIAGAAAVGVYRLVDGLLSEDDDELDRIDKLERDAVVVAGSRLNRIPDARQRDMIVTGLNVGASILATTVASELRRALFGDEEEPSLLETVLMGAVTFILLEELMKPAMGLSHRSRNWSEHGRRLATHLASRVTNNAVRRALPG